MAYNFTPSIINQALATLKEDVKWSELAALSEIDNSTLTAVRKGTRSFSSKLAIKLAHGLGIEISTLYEKIAELSIQKERNRTAERDVHIGSEFVDFVIAKMQSLVIGDFYINISSSPSIEFKSTEANFVQEIIDAVGRGAVFYHIFPKRPVDTNNLTEEQLSLYLIDNSLEIELKFNMWKKQLIKRYPSIKSKIESQIRSISLNIEEFGRYFPPFNRYILSVSKKDLEDGSLDKIASTKCWQEILDTNTKENLYVELGDNAKGVIFQFCDSLINF